MAKKLLLDDLWAEIAPLLPVDRARPKGGHPPVEARDALIGILFVLYTAIPWERLPFEVAGCSGMTCWRRLRSWQDAGAWELIHRHMLDRLSLAGEIDWSRASVDSSSMAFAQRRGQVLRALETPMVFCNRTTDCIVLGLQPIRGAEAANHLSLGRHQKRAGPWHPARTETATPGKFIPPMTATAGGAPRPMAGSLERRRKAIRTAPIAWPSRNAIA